MKGVLQRSRGPARSPRVQRSADACQTPPTRSSPRPPCPAAPEPARSAYTVEGAGRRLGGIGRTTVYGLIAAGKLEAVKLGSRTLITAASIEALAASLPRVLMKLQPRRSDTAR